MTEQLIAITIGFSFFIVVGVFAYYINEVL